MTLCSRVCGLSIAFREEPMQIPKVDKKQVEGFAKVWTYKGVALFLNDAHIQFAADFSNVMLQSFVQQVAAAQKPKPSQVTI
jgi:hypothetical protein